MITFLILFLTQSSLAATMPEDLQKLADPFHAEVTFVKTPSNSAPIDNPPDSLIVKMLGEYQEAVHGRNSVYALGTFGTPAAEDYVENILHHSNDEFLHTELTFLKSAHSIAYGSDGNEEDVLLVLAFRTGGIFRIKFPGDGLSAAKLSAAKDAYAKRNFAEIPTLLKDAIEASTSVADTGNALQFARQINRETNGAASAAHLPLPASLQGLSLRFKRTLRRPVADHRFTIDLHLPGLRGKVTNLSLTKFPHETILDLNGGIGAFADNLLSKTDSFSHDRSGANEDGLYQLAVTTVDGVSSEGFLIVTDSSSEEDPQVSRPTITDTTKENKHGEIYHTLTPEFAFANFTSSLYLPFQRRSLSLAVNFHPDGGNPFRNVVNERIDNPNVTSFSKELEFGEHRLQLVYSESQSYGDLIVSRDAETISAFELRP